MTKHTRAFTLIELMIVIAIISILAAILIPNFIHARSESQTSACEMNEKMLATGEEEYSVDNGGQYVALTTLTTPYLTALPTDPVKKGLTYTLTVGTATSAFGSYQIVDQGSHDSTTTTSLTQDGTTANCAACTSIIWDQNSGIRGK